MIEGIAKSIVAALPPAFLLLAVLNIVLVWLVMSNLEHQNDQRLHILTSVIEKCLAR